MKPYPGNVSPLGLGTKGGTLAVSEAALKDVNGKLLAFGTETCSICPAANLVAR
ncbi:hypothetical protein [Mesorhizobium sp. M0195]|uniref:hypothetical protein n=1 Tax=Mesorhizobium sp. M0195 TaxID=2956910 RepID=UPI00333AC896